jgi:hypothetical protein
MARNKKKKTQGEFTTLKEARAAARERAGNWNVVDIYQEPDGTFSIGGPTNGRAVFVVAIDKAGARYKKKWLKSYTNKKYLGYVKIE